jgi:hypothetical protein
MERSKFWQLRVAQLVKKSAAFYATWRLVIVFSSNCYWAWSRTSWNQSAPSVPSTSFQTSSVITHSPHQSLRCGLLTSDYPIKLKSFSFNPCVLHVPLAVSPWFRHLNNIGRKIQITKTLELAAICSLPHTRTHARTHTHTHIIPLVSMAITNGVLPVIYSTNPTLQKNSNECDMTNTITGIFKNNACLTCTHSCHDTT